MIIGVYLLMSAICALFSLFFLVMFAPPAPTPHHLRQRLLRFAAFALLVNLGALGLFVALSVWAGLLRFGQAQQTSVPGDYLAHGPAGWLMLLILLLGLISPALVGLAVSRRA